MKRIITISLALLLLGAGCRSGRAIDTRNHILPATSTASDDVSADIELEATAGIVATLRMDATANVQAHRAGSEVAGQDGMQLAYGDQVEVIKGEATLSYPEYGVTTLQEGARVTIAVPAKDTSSSSDATGSTLFVRLEVEAGNVWTRLEKLLGPDDAFQASGNSVVATVRGTAFSFGVDGEDVDVSVADHEVEITDEDSTSTPMTLKKGEGFRAKLADMRAMRDTALTQRRARFVHALTVAEQGMRPFQAMRAQVNTEMMRQVANPIQIPIRPRLNAATLKRLTPAQRARLLQRLRVSVQAAQKMEERIVPNMLIPGPLQLLRTK